MLETRQTFHEELAALERQLLEMGRLTGVMVAQAVESLQQADVALAEDVLAQDDAVDTLDRQIEMRCMRLLALQQPMARDLRLIGAALKVITDLERVGDHAVDIAKISRKITLNYRLSRPLVDVGPLATMAERMVHESLQCLLRHDIGLAAQVCADDDQVDAAFKDLRGQLIGATQRDSSQAAAASYMLLAIVYLERIADHATNIAERAFYVETGRFEALCRDDQAAVLAA